MAKTLAERITSARNSKTARITDLEKLIPEAELERDRLSKASTAANAESVDFALSDDDRDEAAAKSERYSRTAKGLDIAVAELREKLDELRASEKQKASEAEQKAAIAERQALADEFSEFMPDAISKMVEMFRKIEANKQRCMNAGAGGQCAEAIARGLSGFTGVGGAPQRFAEMKIPAWDGPGRQWPAATPTLALYAHSDREIRARAAAAREAEQSRWKRYVVEPPRSRDTMISVGTDRGDRGVYREPVIYRMTLAQVENAREQGCTVREAKEGETIGQPSSVVSI